MGRKKKKVKAGNGRGTYFFDESRQKWVVRSPTIYIYNSDGKEHSIRKQLGTFKEETDAIKLWLEIPNMFDKDSGNLNISSKMTFEDLYNSWIHSDKFSELSKGSQDHYFSAYKKCIPFYKKNIKDIKRMELQEYILNYKDKSGAQKFLYNLFKNMFKHAFLMQLLNYNLADGLYVSKHEAKSHTGFTDEEVKLIWNKFQSCEDEKERIIFKYILCLIYSGMRISELFSIKLQNVNLDENYMIGGSKTKAGRNRIIPIHPTIKTFIEEMYFKSYDKIHLSEKKVYKTLNSKMNQIVNALLKSIGLTDKSSHDCRVTFTTRWISQGLKKEYLDKIIGHSTGRLTDDVYNKPEIKLLVDEMAKLRIL